MIQFSTGGHLGCLIYFQQNLTWTCEKSSCRWSNVVGAARNPNINIEIWDIFEFRYPMGRILFGLYELHVLKALTITELEDWRVPKRDPDPCAEYTEDLEGAMLIPETTHEKERDEILAKEETLSMYLDICTYIDLCLEIVSSRPEEHV